MGRSIVFLSDFGYRNEWVGLCHTVMNRIAPESPVVDLDSGQWGLMIDPRGWLAVIRANPGNAAEGLGIGRGDLVWISEPSA
jgi:hypothetical protein